MAVLQASETHKMRNLCSLKTSKALIDGRDSQPWKSFELKQLILWYGWPHAKL